MYSQCRLLLANDSTRHAWRRWIRSTVVSQGEERRGSEEGREVANRETGTHGTAPRRTNCSRGGCATEQAPGQRGGRARGAWCRPRGSRDGVASRRPSGQARWGLGRVCPPSRVGKGRRRGGGQARRGRGPPGLVWEQGRNGVGKNSNAGSGMARDSGGEGRGFGRRQYRWPSARAGGPACSAVPALGRIVPSYSRAVSSSCLVPGVWPKARPDQ